MTSTELVINGYKIIYINNNKPITSIFCIVNTGSVFETKTEIGLAHLIEHVLTYSWKRCKGNCNSYWSKKGVSINGETHLMHTKYSIFGSTENSESMYDYIASILTDPSFNKKTLSDSKHAVKDELLIKLNNPSWKIDDAYAKSIQDNTKYNGYSRSQDIISKIKNLDKITMQDIINFYNKWYRVNNMFLSIVTNESIDKITSYLHKYLKNRPKIIKMKIPLNLSCVDCSSVINRVDAKKTTYSIGFIYNNPDINNFMYYELIKDILLGDICSLLYTVLRDKLNLIYKISLDYIIYSTYILSTFNVDCQIINSKKLYVSLIKTLRNFVNGKFDNKLLNRSKERLNIMYINNGVSNTEDLNQFYSNQYMLTNKADLTMDQVHHKIQNVSKSKIVDIAKKLFNFDKTIVVCETNIKE